MDDHHYYIYYYEREYGVSLMKRTIFFRADADRDIGYGHFVRCLALADMLKNHFQCVFYTQCPTEFQKQQLREVCPFVELPSDSSKFEKFLSVLTGREIVVLDNYFNTAEYQRKIKERGSVLICVDDMHKDHFFADAVINHSLGIGRGDYSGELYTNFFLGLDYALLRKPFLEALRCDECKPKKNKNLDVLVCFGGADKLGIAERIANKLCVLDKVRSINLLSIDGSKRLDTDKIKYLENQSAEDMVRLFQCSDLVVIPSSSIMKEALTCKATILGGYFVENQINSYIQFQRLGAIIGFGDLSEKKNEDSLVAFIKNNDMSQIRLNDRIYTSDIKENYINLFSRYASI